MGNESLASTRSGRERDRSDRRTRPARQEAGSPAACAIVFGALAMSAVADAEAQGRMIDPPVVRTPGTVRVGGKPVELPDPSVEVSMQLANSPRTFFPNYNEERVPLPSQLPRKAFLEQPGEYLQFQVTVERETPITVHIYPEVNRSSSARNLRVKAVVSGDKVYSNDLVVPAPGRDTFKYKGKEYSNKPIAVTVRIPPGTSQVVVDTTRVDDDGDELSAVVDLAGYEETAPGQSESPLNRPLPDTAPVPISHSPDIHERPRSFNALIRVNQLPPATATPGAGPAAPRYRVRVTNMQPYVPGLGLKSKDIIVTPVRGQKGLADIRILSKRSEGTALVPVAYTARVDVSTAREFDNLMVQFQLAAPLARSEVGARGPDVIPIDVALFEQAAVAAVVTDGRVTTPEVPNRLLHVVLPDGPRLPALNLRCDTFWAHPVGPAKPADADTDRYATRRAVLQCSTDDSTKPTAAWEAILPAEAEHLTEKGCFNALRTLVREGILANLPAAQFDREKFTRRPSACGMSGESKIQAWRVDLRRAR